MKKLLITLIAVISFYGYSHAQTANSTEFGVFAGIGSSTISDGTARGYNSSQIFAFNAGVSADYYFSERWSLKAKALYDQKGTSGGLITATSTSGTITTYYPLTYHLNYITVPVMANWHFGRRRNWFLNFGPYVGFLMSANATGGYPYPIKDFFNSTDGGLSYGIGVKLPVAKRTKFYVEVDGQSGVANAFKGDGNTSLNSRSGVSVGVNF